MSFFQVVIQALLSFLMLKIGFGVIAVAAVHFGVALFFTILLSVLSKVYLVEKISYRSKSVEDKKYRKQLFFEILIFSSFVIINTIVDTLNKTLDKTILGFYNAESVSTYQLAYTIPAYLISFTSIISIVFNQHINEIYYSNGGQKGMNEVFLKVSKIQIIFTFLLVGGFIACGKEFVFVWIDDSRIQVYLITCILMVTYSITCCNRLAIMIRRVQNYHINASVIYLGVAIFNVALSILLVNLVDRENAIWACVAGTVTTYVLGHWIIMQIYDKKVSGIDIPNFFKTFIIHLVVAATIDLLIIRFFELLPISEYWVLFILKGISFVALYFIAIYFVDKKSILSTIKRFKRRKDN